MAALPAAAEGEPSAGAMTRIADGVFETEHRDATGMVEGMTTVVLGERLTVVVESCFATPGVREDVIRIQSRGDDPLDLLVDAGAREAGQPERRIHLDPHSGVRIVSRVERRKVDAARAFERLREEYVDPLVRALVDEWRVRIDHARARASMALENARPHWS